jgi:chemotaxis protein MotA
MAAPDADMTLEHILVKQKKSVVSIPTIAGLLVGVGLFVGSIAISTDKIGMFISVPSILMVLGGTLANAFISYQGRYVVRALFQAGQIYKHARITEAVYYAESRRVLKWAQIVRGGGVIALEQHIKKEEAHDNLLKYAVNLVVDGFKGWEVRELLGNALMSSHERELRQVEVLRNMAATAPAFGMIGTLVGLIIMLDALGEGAAALGSGLAMALLTTLYGVLLARLVFQPAADKTLQRAEVARFRNNLVREAFVMLADERAPRYIESRINSYLDPDVLAVIRTKKRSG